MSTAIVTGCAGFIGSHLTDRLLADGREVVGIDSFEDYYPRAMKEDNIAQARDHESFELIEADLLSLAETGRLRELMDDAEVVYHLAAQPGVRASWGQEFHIYERNNIMVTQALLETANHVEVPAFVYASSSSVYGDTDILPMREDAVCVPYSPYGVTKLTAEHLCRLYTRNFGFHTASLRFFTVYGPRQRPDMAFRRFIDKALAGEPIVVYGDGEQTRDFTYVTDIVDGIIAAAAAPAGMVANLAGGSRVSLVDVIDTLADFMGVAIRVDRQPRQAGDVRDTWASIEVAQKVLNYGPEVGLAEGLAAEVAWLRERRFG